MKRAPVVLPVWIAIALLTFVQACSGTASLSAGGSSATPKSEEEKTLYALGLSLGGNVSGLDLSAQEIAMVSAGLSDAASGAEPKVEIQTYGPKIRDWIQARRTQAADREKEGAKEFMEQMAASDGAESTSSGLIFVDVEAGTGASPKPSDTVKVHYRGTLTDGTQFDSSYDRGEPTQFPLHGVIPCWTEGLQKMRVGGKAKLVCPSSIAYGDAGRPPVIPPGATLVFEVELLEIVGG